MNRVFNYCLPILVVFCLSTSNVFAYDTLDTIIATVDNDVITESDLDKKIAVVKENFKHQQQEMPDDKEVRKQILDRLIVDSIQLQMAQKGGITVSDERLNQAIENIAQRRQMDMETFKQQLASEGMSYQELREQVRHEITIQQLQQAKLRNRIQVSEQEVDNYLASTEGKKRIAPRYKISQILLPVADEATADVVETARQEISNLRQDMVQGKYTIDDLSGEKTIRGSVFTGSQMDWMEKDELPSLFAETVAQLKRGEISSPVRSGAGWHLVILTNMTGGEELVHQTLARHILVKPSEVRSDAKSKEIIDDLYVRLLKGEDFTLLAKEYSEDSGSALQGGELGWSSPGQFVPAFEKTLLSLKKGEISQPFKTEFGWHVIQKLDERDHNVTQENIKNQAYQAIYERKFNEELESWLVTIREEAFVEIR